MPSRTVVTFKHQQLSVVVPFEGSVVLQVRGDCSVLLIFLLYRVWVQDYDKKTNQGCLSPVDFSITVHAYSGNALPGC